MNQSEPLLLLVNPGSTSTKMAVWRGSEPLFSRTVQHGAAELANFHSIAEQHDFRKRVILEILRENGCCLSDFTAVVGRGGLLRPLPAGTYRVDAAMIADLEAGVQGEHASNLGGLIAAELAREAGITAYVVDPVVVDEMDEVAKLTGHPRIFRQSVFHALNHKAVAHLACRKLNKTYAGSRLIVAHLGGGISVGVHRDGRVVDVNNALDGDGPMAPERAGSLPAGQWLSECLRPERDAAGLRRQLAGLGGWKAHLGTSNAREVHERMVQGDRQAALVFEATAYQVAKEIGAAATVLEGKVDAIVFTGGLAHDADLIGRITARVAFIAPVLVFPGEDEMRALAEGVLRVLRGEEPLRIYADFRSKG